MNYNIPRPAPVTRIRFPTKLMFMATNALPTTTKYCLLNIFIPFDPTNNHQLSVLILILKMAE